MVSTAESFGIFPRAEPSLFGVALRVKAPNMPHPKTPTSREEGAAMRESAYENYLRSAHREGCPCTTGENIFDGMTLAELSVQQRRPFQEYGHLVPETEAAARG